jgi:citrate lyase subunit beta-like protein
MSILASRQLLVRRTPSYVLPFSAPSSYLRQKWASAPCFNIRNYSSAPLDDDSREERPRRCLFSVPGADARKIEKAKTIGADAVVFDLEDGVAHHQKDKARELVRETLMQASSSFGNSELCVRINGLGTNEMARKDLEAILPCPGLQAIVIPKVECDYSINYVSDQIEALGANPDIRIIAAIESASGMVNIRDIASANSRLDALVFASEDYW